MKKEWLKTSIGWIRADKIDEIRIDTPIFNFGPGVEPQIGRPRLEGYFNGKFVCFLDDSEKPE